jgi:hypothetical protein
MLLNAGESVAMAVCNALGGGDELMRKKLRKTLPYLAAIFLGTMAAALIVGVALLAAHS